MSAVSVNRNVVANVAGGAWAALIGLAVVPLYIRLMGIESWGIVGILVSVQAVLTVLDLGLSQTISREIARLSAGVGNSLPMAHTVRTIETVYWGTSVLVGLIVLSASAPIANHWLSPDQLSRPALQEAFWAMALVIALRWPVAIYSGALIGLQRQVLLNVLVAGFATVQAVGAVAILWGIAPTVQYFLLWQAAIALLQVFTFRIVVYRSIAAPEGGRFQKEIVAKLWRFASGLAGIAVVSMLLTQTDKILLSTLLTLTEFGYYTFATTVAASLYALTGAVFAAYQPKLAQAVAQGVGGAGVATVYHQGCRVMAFAIIPAGAMLAVFSREIVWIWTRDQTMVAQSAQLISLLVAGNLLHGLMHMPYAAQLAVGWTRLAFIINVVAVLVLGPAIYLATSRWGAIGAAGVWLALNLGYVTIGVHCMHRKLLQGEKVRWYLSDVGMPAGAVLSVVLVARYALPDGLPSPWQELSLAAIGLAAAAAAFFATGAGRAQFRRFTAQLVP